jgi:hypothetical protein
MYSINRNMVDLGDNVDEVKKQIREAEDPDLEELLEKEKNGKDRKTVKEFLEKKIDQQEVEIEETEDELVEEIEEETEGGLLSDFSRQQVLTAGTLMGLVVGVIVGAVALGDTLADQEITSVQAEDRVEELITAGGQYTADQLDVSAQNQNSMFYINVTADVQSANGTRTASQTYYMSLDGSLMFPEQIRSPLGSQQVVIDVEDALRNARQPTPDNQTQTNQTSNTTQ